MNIIKLQEVVDSIKTMVDFGASDSILIKELIEFLYDESNGSISEYILIVDDLKKEEAEKERQRLYVGLEDAMHNVSHFSKLLTESKRPLARIKDFNKVLFTPEDGNIAHVIRTAMAYFPDGDCRGASENGKYFFESFKDLFLANKEKYLNGDSTRWAKRFGYYDYLKKVIDKNS